MSQSRHYPWFAILLIVLVPGLFLLVPSLTSRFVPGLYSGIVQDAVILVATWGLNHYLFKIPIKWWHSTHGWQQFLACLPALVLLLIPKLPAWIALGKLSFSPMIFFYAGYILLIGLTEEYIYRGVLLPLLAKALPGKTLLVIIIDSLAFGSVHLINLTGLNWSYVLPQLFLAAVTGVLLCGVYLKTKNLILPILLHAASDLNMINTFMSHTHNRAGLNTPWTISLLIVLVAAILFLLVVGFVYWQTRHINIEKQLFN
ncbi:CPBP family intramembrane glutamic endopeptidase [Lactiplantibacillus nangangensis]|uniref:CPBP family intramembrane glutamic endopeptidase n=1 Tax=Lactiplantibacillus nangangensis TaxID=2559917 RepID=A0ABW1SMZ4_9LACO|nr:CPBP family intramembrane glutamic endopeptidase [Lactiplantibacillus nangangensis]